MQQMIPFLPVKPPTSLATLQPVPMNWTTNPIGAFHDVPLLPGSPSTLFFSLAAQAPDGARRLCSTPGLFLSVCVGRARPVYTAAANTHTGVLYLFLFISFKCSLGHIVICSNCSEITGRLLQPLTLIKAHFSLLLLAVLWHSPWMQRMPPLLFEFIIMPQKFPSKVTWSSMTEKLRNRTLFIKTDRKLCVCFVLPTATTPQIADGGHLVWKCEIICCPTSAGCYRISETLLVLIHTHF